MRIPAEVLSAAGISGSVTHHLVVREGLIGSVGETHFLVAFGALLVVSRESVLAPLELVDVDASTLTYKTGTFRGRLSVTLKDGREGGADVSSVDEDTAQALVAAVTHGPSAPASQAPPPRASAEPKPATQVERPTFSSGFSAAAAASDAASDTDSGPFSSGFSAAAAASDAAGDVDSSPFSSGFSAAASDAAGDADSSPFSSGFSAAATASDAASDAATARSVAGDTAALTRAVRAHTEAPRLPRVADDGTDRPRAVIAATTTTSDDARTAEALWSQVSSGTDGSSDEARTVAAPQGALPFANSTQGFDAAASAIRAGDWTEAASILRTLSTSFPLRGREADQLSDTVRWFGAGEHKLAVSLLHEVDQQNTDAAAEMNMQLGAALEKNGQWLWAAIAYDEACVRDSDAKRDAAMARAAGAPDSIWDVASDMVSATVQAAAAQAVDDGTPHAQALARLSVLHAANQSSLALAPAPLYELAQSTARQDLSCALQAALDVQMVPFAEALIDRLCESAVSPDTVAYVLGGTDVRDLFREGAVKLGITLSGASIPELDAFDLPTRPGTAVEPSEEMQQLMARVRQDMQKKPDEKKGSKFWWIIAAFVLARVAYSCL